ncbi:hypothetical protein PE067_07605 [Paracoccus sp. DMF-8]|uniref:hypothetical protein n=1 Tax=Paracoccus sp. DMF-8 TaxID=3019445 RepID=UPI0023E76F0C|nr:hypothetical protein [Paracoccus sp. DMF-8]MDF3606008.1 hypothetical protein [Paracoccus sp. DMF-8]
MADEAVHIGPPPANQSYLDRRQDHGRHARQTGAEAGASGLRLPVRAHRTSPPRWRPKANDRLHRPAQRPPSRSMGDKIDVEKIAQDAGVNTSCPAIWA